MPATEKTNAVSAPPQQQLHHQSPGQRRLRILSAAAVETTAHGLGRTVGERHPLVRALWSVAFLCVLGIFLKQFVDACNRLYERPTSTSIEPNEEKFHFPDVHVCPVTIVSASYPSQMGPVEKNLTDTLMSRILGTLDSVNRSSMYLAGQIFTGSLPYRLFSSNFGLRKEQTVIGASVMPITKTLALDTDIIDLHHHRYLNCFTIRVKDSAVRNLLNSVLGYIDLTLYTDTSYNESEIIRYYGGYMDSRGFRFDIYEPLIGSGFRIYFTPEGHYPDDYAPSVTVSPGFQHHIVLSMKYTKLAPQKGQCMESAPDIQLLDQFTGLPVAYKYDLSTCYAMFLNDMFNYKLNCFLSGYAPVLYENRNLLMCSSLNFIVKANASVASIADKLDFLKGFTNGDFVGQLSDSVSNMTATCQARQPCNDLKYITSLSSTLFPMRHAITNELRNIFQDLTNDRLSKNFTTPGRLWILRLHDSALPNASTSGEAESNFILAVSENIMRVQISSAELMSTVYNQKISYGTDDLMAGVGGLLGLYMGCSVLTLMEIIELAVSLIRGNPIISNSVQEGCNDQQQQQQKRGQRHHQELQLSEVKTEPL